MAKKAVAVETEKKELTPEQKKIRSQKSKESRDRRFAAMATVVDFVKELDTELPDEVKMAIARLSGERKSSGSTSVNKGKIVADYIYENQPVAELDFYGEFHMSRQEFKALANRMVKKESDPEQRIWMHFDPVDETYSILGKGATAPKGWTGAIPNDIVEE